MKKLANLRELVFYSGMGVGLVFGVWDQVTDWFSDTGFPTWKIDAK